MELGFRLHPSPKIIYLAEILKPKHSYIRTFVHSYIRTFIHSYIHAFVHSYIRKKKHAIFRIILANVPGKIRLVIIPQHILGRFSNFFEKWLVIFFCEPFCRNVRPRRRRETQKKTCHFSNNFCKRPREN